MSAEEGGVVTDADTGYKYVYRKGGWLLGWFHLTARGWWAVVPGLAVQPLGEYKTPEEAETAIRNVDPGRLVMARAAAYH